MQNETTKLTFSVFELNLERSHKLQLTIGSQNDDSDWLVVGVTTIRF